ncbi:MAG: IclR family transcriptional regulator [Paenibacillus sp.]|nr:IclR family transcriptional regulator [Paenibacillus sp.]
MVILDGKEGVYIDKIEGDKAAIRYSRIGRRVPLHSSAAGKTLIAFRNPEEVEQLLKGYPYIQQTASTVADEASFLHELADIRLLGYALDDQENEPGVRCAAAPIFNHAGDTAAAMSISTMISVVDDEQFQQCIELLKREAAQISQLLGYKSS